MLLLVIKVAGWLIAHTPEPVLRVSAALLGDFVFYGLPRRRRIVLSNLHHAFPAQPAMWHRRIGRESCRRMIETGLLSLAAPFLPERRIRRIATLGPSVQALAHELAARPRPVVLATLHLAHWESQTWLKRLSPVPLPEFGIIFRPLDNPAADRFVKETRERFGMKLLSRKEGFADALKILRGNGCVGVLVDQNAGLQGALTLFFDRVCSTTELPGVFAAKFGAEVRTFYPRRTGFWRVQFESAPIPHDNTSTTVTLGINRWLENLLRADDDLCASWLWSHDRWRNQDMPPRRFRLEAKRNLLDAELAARGQAELPRRTRIWVRLPNWLGDVVMAVPLLRALRASRPDAEITLLARSQFLPLLESWKVADRLEPLPPRGLGYFVHFRRLRKEYPDIWLLFTNSARGDIEAWLSGTRQRFGIVRPGKSRPLLSHSYRVPPDFNEQQHHQLELWENFLRHFGLAAPLDRTPLSTLHSQPPARCPIGLICGSENTPEKRWPVPHWRALIESLPDESFILFGTANDQSITNAVALGFDPARVRNQAGKTNLLDFARQLQTCRLLITNDTGGMHLANALGVPVIALFGPTNPTRTGPVFSAPATLLRPPHGTSLSDLPPATVIAALEEPFLIPKS